VRFAFLATSRNYRGFSNVAPGTACQAWKEAPPPHPPHIPTEIVIAVTQSTASASTTMVTTRDSNKDWHVWKQPAPSIVYLADAGGGGRGWLLRVNRSIRRSSLCDCRLLFSSEQNTVLLLFAATKSFKIDLQPKVGTL